MKRHHLREVLNMRLRVEGDSHFALEFEGEDKGVVVHLNGIWELGWVGSKLNKAIKTIQERLDRAKRQLSGEEE